MADTRVLITGISGQDGYYLSRLLLARGHSVFGLARTDSDLTRVPTGVTVLEGDLEDHNSLRAAIVQSQPDEVYNLAGVSDLQTAFAFPEKTLDVNYYSVGTLLEESLKQNPTVRFLQASSSEVFLPSGDALDEDSPRDWNTTNPYAKAKMMADKDFIKTKRRTQGAFVCSAILFNHESPIRKEKYVTRKITRTLTKVKLGMEKELLIGSLDGKRDWGFAGDYAEAMTLMLAQDIPQDFVIGTGRLHSVREAIDIACKVLEMECSWVGEGRDARGKSAGGSVIVRVDPSLYRPTELHPKFANISKARRLLDWKPSLDFAGLITTMVQHDLAELQTAR